MTDVTYDFIGPEPLTRITEDLWVNPNHVSIVEPWAGIRGGSVVRDENKSTMWMGDRELTVPLPLHEVVALLNGSA